MIDKLSPLAQGLVGAPGSEGVRLPGSGAVASDVERFQLAMNSPASPVSSSGAVATVGTTVTQISPAPALSVGSSFARAPSAEATSVAARAAQAGRRSVGDAILDTFRSVAGNASQDWGQARQAVMNPSMTTTDMLQTQMKLIQVSFQIDLIGKGVSKVTTNLEQTLKTQ